MFANMKKKIFDEVKASPQKFQQFAQAAQAAVSSASSTASESVSGSDNFFSITEEDTPQNSPNKLPSTANKVPPTTPAAAGGNTLLPKPSPLLNNGIPAPRQRKLSNSSIASDISFRLPAYDSPAVYHLQSDLDISASEVEESSVSSTAHLDLISKEQLHSAYKKALDRYQKYRSRYTDLAKRYRDLERDSTKARAVLVETQDKAIRRISELREQCTLEQQAKAHLEEALRLEMDDMQCKIQAYQTKFKLLGEKPEDIITTGKQQNQEESLINFDADDIKTDTISTASDCTEKACNHLQKIEDQSALLTRKEHEISELTKRLSECNQTIEELRKREEENALLLAQNKLMIHSELDNKEREMRTLKQSVADVEKKLEQTEKENIQMRKKMTELTDIQHKYKQLVAVQQDFEAKAISYEHLLKQTQKDVKDKEKQIESSSKSYEDKIKSITEEYEMRVLKLSEENEMLKRNVEENGSSADLSEQLNSLNSEKASLEEKLNQMTSERADFEKITAELKDKIAKMEQMESQLRKEIEDLHASRATDAETQNKLLELQNLNADKNAICDSLSQKIEELNEITSKLSESETKLTQEKAALQEEIERLEREKQAYLEHKGEIELLMEKERSESKSQVTNILQEISRMEEELKEVKEQHKNLEKQKQSLEKKIDKMSKQDQENKDGSSRWQSMVSEAEDRIQKMDSKMKHLESENKTLSEEKVQSAQTVEQLQKTFNEERNAFKDRERELANSLKETEGKLEELTQKHEISNETIKKLQEKMSQLLDENSRLHNTAEIMEHECRSVKTETEAKEKEKLCIIESNKFLEKELQALQEENEILKRERDNLNEMSNNMRGDLDLLNRDLESEKARNAHLLSENEALKKRLGELEGKLEHLTGEITNITNKYEMIIEENEKKYATLSTEKEKLIAKEKEQSETIVVLQNEIKTFNETSHSEKIKLEELEKEFKVLQESKESTQEELKKLLSSLSDVQNNNATLKEENDAYKKEIDALNNHSQTRLAELENLLKRTNDEKQTLKESIKNATDLEKKLENYEELKIENEYLTTLVKQLENDLRKQTDDKSKHDAEISSLKEKLKSQQCEMYVLLESKDKHADDMRKKEDELKQYRDDLDKLKNDMQTEKQECARQAEHNQFVMQQNDKIQKELLVCQQKLEEAHRLCSETRESYQEILNENATLKENVSKVEKQSKTEIDALKNEISANKIIINDLTKDLKKTTKLLENLENIEKENKSLNQKVKELETQLENNPPNIELDQNANADSSEIVHLRTENERLMEELEELKQKLLQLQNSSSLNELFSPAQDEIMSEHYNEAEIEALTKEKQNLQEKLNKILNEVQDVSNRNLFLEQKCENYLILEQSNERLKLANEKLSRQLDETLVSIHHNEGISANTEFEYLRNIMFQYLTGNINGNATLVKVIAAVLKFSPQQTQVALEKEHQRHSLLGQLNKLL